MKPNRIIYYLSILFEEYKMFPIWLSHIFASKKIALYVGCTRMGNLGDEAIFDALKELVGPEVFLYEIPYHNPTAGNFLRKIFFKKPDFIILGGGTIIRKAANESYLRILNRLSLEWPESKIIILGPGVANPEFAKYIGFPIDINGWSTLLNKATFISVRGVLSKKELDSWKTLTPVEIFHDPAIYFTKSAIKLKGKKKKIAVNFADIGDRIYGKNKIVIESFALKIVEKLISENWEVYLYPTTKSDLNYMLNKIGLKKFYKIKIYDDYKNIDKSLCFLESMDVFLGQRLHSVIFSSTVFTPFHALEYEPKTSDFLNTLGLNDYLTRVDELDVNAIFDKINALYSQIENEQQVLFDKLTTAKAEQKKCMDMFLSKV